VSVAPPSPARAETPGGREGSADLAVVRRFMASVAHEIRNPLAAIGAGVQYLARIVSGGPEERETVEMVLAEVRRLDRIVGEMASVGLVPQPRCAPTDLRETARRAIRAVADTARAQGVALLLEAHPAVGPATIDADLVHRAVVELLENAIEASRHGARVVVRTGFAYARPAEGGGAAADGAGAFLVRVVDQGEGIAPEHRDLVLEPFFSTRRRGKGLGLTTCRLIAAAHGGRVDIDSEPGHGTTATLVLPAAAESGGAPS
jgi:two-component system sensor histidine kinase HydH